VRSGDAPPLTVSLCQNIDTSVPWGKMQIVWTFGIENAIWSAVPVVLVLAAVRPVSEKALLGFQGRFGLDADDTSADQLPRLLFRNRAFRLIGAAIGLSIDPLLTLAGGRAPGLGLLYGLTGYLCGDVLATVTRRTDALGPRRASLSPRRATDYLSRLALITPAAAVGLGLAALLVYAIEPRRPLPSFTGSVIAIIPAIVAAAVTYGAIRIVVSRRQPVTTPDLIALDDSLRAQCVHSAAAIGGAVAFVGAASCLLQMGGYASPEWLHLTGLVLAVIALGLAVWVWGYRTTFWQVRRAVSA
jgi:hypothetical protein